MGKSLRSSLLHRFRTALPGHLEAVDTAAAEDASTSRGQAVHFDWYNRYSTMVSSFFKIIVALFSS
jgi:hypothetical protein